MMAWLVSLAEASSTTLHVRLPRAYARGFNSCCRFAAKSFLGPAAPICEMFGVKSC